ncbi:uncharacterized protein LOC132593186 [Zootoca vivipara]|uniref:uncharacterized protein LOC132593186 n=1 Tax=Zootoca vivipara TaxID=8524 RepID=UPI00293BDC8C|nr:uncharacterized protein LOC132593186 [Zootoca vivipara]
MIVNKFIKDQVLKAPVQALPQGGPPVKPRAARGTRCREALPSQGTDSLTFAFQLLQDEQLYILGVIQSCQAAELRGLRTLKCSKQETAKAILDILGPLEHFRDRPLTLALALEALLQLSTMRPKFSCDMISAILHRTMEAVLQGPEKEEEREELKRHFRLLLGSLLMEAPNPGTLLQLLSMTVVRPDLACFRLKLEEGSDHVAVSAVVALCGINTVQCNRLVTIQSRWCQ